MIKNVGKGVLGGAKGPEHSGEEQGDAPTSRVWKRHMAVSQAQAVREQHGETASKLRLGQPPRLTSLIDKEV